ncbi:cell division protein FtsQ/DivIB [Actinomadura violacea]|uniref:FtsQ-type POTRA domain-containing protein n=1 Tax=Actinomadura violacea TaxID=2819934 RepID=A0ABS3RZ17_9ACTN|nr:FtsQ-type POTRA domain-containing protein [Actinomadura violacea]MBO2461997.1 FtsQ-type POTRA domain-containing protein [Actinomadura violacea]
MTEARTDQPDGGTEDPAAGPEPAAGRPRGGRWKVIFVALLVVAALGAVGWVLLGSKLLVVRHVEVSGAALAPRDRIVAAAGIRLGVPMARLDTGAIRARVERLREVESAEVRRAWPATVRIVVHERVPVATLERGGRYQRLDRYGVTVADGATRPAGLPELAVASPGPSDPATLAALKVLTGLPDRLRGRVTEVEAAGPAAVTLHMKGGLTVTWGPPERAAEKIRLLDSLERSPSGRSLHGVDVSSPEVLITR